MSMHPQASRTDRRLFAPGLLLATVVAGCAAKPDPVTTNISYGPDDRFANRVLDRSERGEVLRIMGEVVEGPADDPARPAPDGVRWSDVRLAATRACSRMDLAIRSMTLEEDGDLKRIEILSVGDIPFELLVRREAPPTIYSATATGGFFGERVEAAERLLREFEKAMRAYGAKPGWPPLTDD